MHFNDHHQSENQKKGSRFFLLSVVRIPFYTTFTRNSIFFKPATTKGYRVINGKVVIFKDKDNNNNLMYGKVVSIGLHFSTFLYNWLLVRVCGDVIKITLLHFTTNSTDIVLKIIKSTKKVAKLFGIPLLCCIFVVSERDINNHIKNYRYESNYFRNEKSSKRKSI